MYHNSRLGTSARIRKRMFAPQLRSPDAPPPHQRKPTLSDALLRSSSTTVAKRRSCLSQGSGSANRLGGAASCKRKLSFSDTLQVHEIPRVRLAAADYEAFRKAAEGVAAAKGADRETHVAAWREVASCMLDPALKQTYRACGVRRSLAAIFRNVATIQPAVVEMAAAVIALAADTFGNGTGNSEREGKKVGTQIEEHLRDTKPQGKGEHFGDDASVDDDADDVDEELALCRSVVSCLCSRRASNHTTSSLVAAIVGFSWSKRFPGLFRTASNAALVRALQILRKTDDLDVHVWKSVMVVVNVFQRSNFEASSKRNGSGAGKAGSVDLKTDLLSGRSGLSASRLGFTEADAKLILQCLRKYAKDGGEVAFAEALRACAALCERSAEVAAMFVENDASKVVMELVRGEKLAVQCAAVGLLGVLSGPAILGVRSVL